MDNSERICVLIPAYNMGKYLESCIDSILAQTYQNIHVLLVDDGSTDNTVEICEKYKEMDSRFESIHIENSGHGIARNVGLDHCTEKYIAMIDADDCINTTFIESMYDVMVKCDADMVNPSYIHFHTDDEIDLSMNADAVEDDPTVYNRDEAMEYLTHYKAHFFMPQKLYKTDLFKDYRYPDVQVNVDVWAIHHLIIRSKNVAVSKKAIYFWRQSPEGMTRNFSPQKVSAALAALDRAETAAKHGYTELVPLYEREFHFQAVLFYRKCRNRHIDGKKVLQPYKDKLLATYRFNGEEYKKMYDRKERVLHWFFARNYLIFDILDRIIDDSTRDRERE